MPASAPKDRRRPFGLNAATLRVLESAGYIKTASRRADYSFRELVLLRTVGALQAVGLPTRSINRALQELRPWLDETFSTGRIVFNATAEGIRVREGRSLWEPATGQYALLLEDLRFESDVVAIASHEKMKSKSRRAAHTHYLRGSNLEDDDVKAARAAYEACLAGDCSHLEARINLGRLLHLEGLLREAEAVYTAQGEPSAILFFNLGVLLEDMNRDLEAMEAYRKAIVHDPGLADAHFNLSLLHERSGQAQASFRHLLAYRRLSVGRRSDGRNSR